MTVVVCKTWRITGMLMRCKLAPKAGNKKSTPTASVDTLNTFDIYSGISICSAGRECLAASGHLLAYLEKALGFCALVLRLGKLDAQQQLLPFGTAEQHQHRQTRQIPITTSPSATPRPQPSDMASLGEDLLGIVNKLQDLVFNTIGNDSLDLPQIVWHTLP